jgi:BarA-like signal transduction histidine kinase
MADSDSGPSEGSLPELEREPRRAMWEDAIARAQEADDPEAVLDEQLAATEDMYRSAFATVPEEHLDEMLAVLEDAFRRRADMDERESPS